MADKRKRVKRARKKRVSQKVLKTGFSLAEVLPFYRKLRNPGAASKPVKIPADFDTALAALAAVPSKKRRKRGQS